MILYFHTFPVFVQKLVVLIKFLLQFVTDASHKLIRNLRIIKPRDLYP